MCVCVFVVVCVWVTGTGRALTRLTVVVQGAIECNTFAGAPVRGGTHSARPFALRRLYLHAVKCSPPNTTKRESFVTATSNRYKRARAASTREVFVDYSFIFLYLVHYLFIYLSIYFFLYIFSELFMYLCIYSFCYFVILVF